MEVLRVEKGAHGPGPYWSKGGGCVDCGSDRSGQAHRPIPCDDPGINEPFYDLNTADRRDYFFGFLDLAQLLEWWTIADLRYMAEQGTQVSRYEVERHVVIVGDRQVVFKRTTATFLGVQTTSPTGRKLC